MRVHIDQRAAPSRTDPIARAATQVIGGPLGRYADPLVRGWRQLAAVLAGLVAIPMALSVALRGYCLDGGWRSPGQFFHMCFSDLAVTYEGQRLGEGLPSFLDGGALAPAPPHPPLTAMLLSLTGGIVPGGAMDAQVRFFFGLWAILTTVLVAMTVYWTAAATPDSPMRAAHIALSPVVALITLISADIAGVALASAGLYYWSRSRTVAAGILLGLAISARTYPILILLAIVLVCARAGRWRAAGSTCLSALGAVGVVFGLVLWRNPEGALAAYQSWLEASAGYGSPWVLPQLFGHGIPAPLLSVLAVAGWAAAVFAGGALALSGPRRPGVAELSLVMIVIVLVTGKTFPVQSSLWLVPLVALCGLRWRDHLVWAGCEALHFGAVWLVIARDSVPERGLPDGWYAVAVAARLAGVLWLGRQVVRQARDRAPALLDPEEADPIAGPVAGAHDALVAKIV